jgi:hypothetical protein
MCPTWGSRWPLTRVRLGKNARFGDLTGGTITQMYMARAGTAGWGADQCENDPGGSVDFDERLRITGVSSGRYDVRFTGKAGRSCVAKGIEAKVGTVFSIGQETANCSGE